MADGFWKIDYFGVRHPDCKESKCVEDKKERISELMQRFEDGSPPGGPKVTYSHSRAQSS